MAKRIPLHPLAKWLVGAGVITVGAVATVAIGPSDAEALSCVAGSNCAVFTDADGQEFDVCAFGVRRDDMSSLWLYDNETGERLGMYQR